MLGPGVSLPGLQSLVPWEGVRLGGWSEGPEAVQSLFPAPTLECTPLLGQWAVGPVQGAAAVCADHLRSQS